jgi:Ca2+-binding RTX toxin-like protein
MTGAAYIGRGNDLNNTIVGTSGDNLIAGAGGADVMIGGAGNDGYWVEQAGDVVIEAVAEGNNDYVVSSIHEYNLAAHVETLYMSGAAYIGRGNDLNNTIVGTSGDNLIAGAGGADVMIGGAGNDGYWVEQAGDVVIEAAGEGNNDYVVSSIHEYNLAANVETLYMSGNAIVGRGNELNNSLYGTAGNNHLDGGAGNDVLAGGAGSDTYYFGRGYGVDTIYENDATAGHADVLQMVGNVRSDQLWLRKAGNDLEIAVIGSADKAVVQNWYAGAQYRVEQIKTSSNQTLLHTQVDVLVQAMAAFAPPVAGQSTLPANYQSALAPVIAASWN